MYLVYIRIFSLIHKSMDKVSPETGSRTWRDTIHWDNISILCSLFLEHRLGIFNILLAQTPLILQRRIKTRSIDILGPPFTPASQENLLRISREIVDGDRAEDILGTYSLLDTVFKSKTQSKDPYPLARSWHRAYPWSMLSSNAGQAWCWG
jgi:hypothetical protein